MNGFTRLQKFARSLGGEIIVVKSINDPAIQEGVNHSYYACPFNSDLAIAYRAKKVYVNKEPIGGIDGSEFLSALIHELGHTLASRDIPPDAREVDFLGWEYLTAKKTRNLRVWHKGMASYIVNWDYDPEDHPEKANYYDEFGEIPRRLLPLFYAERVKASQEAGCVSPELQPISVRDNA